jgi:hypothetical protein
MEAHGTHISSSYHLLSALVGEDVGGAEPRRYNTPLSPPPSMGGGKEGGMEGAP